MAHKRGQAALEFLSTYGFAFLIILVMIGALTYFGILSPSKFVPGSCVIGPEFKCKDRQITGGGTATATLSIRVVNQLGNEISLFPAGSTNASNSTYGNGPCTVPAGNPVSIVSGQETTIQCTLTASSTNFPAKGEKLRATVDFAYKELGGTYPHPVRAEVVETLQ